MSIKPKYANAILDGSKLYEYRKRLPKNTDIQKVYLYVSKPTKAIIAYFTIGSIISDNPQKVWELTKKDGGITKKQFNDYFKGHSVAYALKIGDITIIATPIDPKAIIKDFVAPQNFIYTDLELDRVWHSTDT